MQDSFKRTNENKRMSRIQLYNKNTLNLTLLKNLLREDTRLQKDCLDELLQDFHKICDNEPNIVRLQQPVIIIGDIHGQYADLLKIMSFGRSLQDPKHEEEKLLFLGDYVDRGLNGTEVIIYLISLKVLYPKKITLLRGNHESRQMTQTFNFYQQFCQKYDQNRYDNLMNCFDKLPLVCVVNQRYFCVHGGISPSTMTLDEINKIQRKQEVSVDGALCDFLWADPIDNDLGKIEGQKEVQFNESRGCSIWFGAKMSNNFMRKNKLVTIIRGHQVQMQGFKKYIWPGWKDIPSVYTIFSAPNYCGTYSNKGAILFINKNSFSIKQYKHDNPKCYVPEKYNAFNFSLPKLSQLADKFARNLARAVVNQCLPEFSQNSDQLIIQKLLEMAKVSKLKKDFKIPKNKKPQMKINTEHNQELYDFRRSQQYYHKSQQRPQIISLKK